MRSPRATTSPTSCRPYLPLQESPLRPRPSNLPARATSRARSTLDRHHCLPLYLLPIPCLCSHSNRSQRRRELPSIDNARFRTVPTSSIFYCSTRSASSPSFLPFTLRPHACDHSPCPLLRPMFFLSPSSLFPFIPSYSCVFPSLFLCSTSSGPFVVYISFRCLRRPGFVLYSGLTCI
jgi:hypothetical protein